MSQNLQSVSEYTTISSLVSSSRGLCSTNLGNPIEPRVQHAYSLVSEYSKISVQRLLDLIIPKFCWLLLKLAESFYSIISKKNLSDDYFNRFNYEIYGGTPVLGVDGNVLIGHGISNESAIKNMILLGKDLINSKLTSKIKTAFKWKN